MVADNVAAASPPASRPAHVAALPDTAYTENMRRTLLSALAATALLLAVVVVGNLRSLWEGAQYLRQWRAWNPGAVQRIDPNGPYGICYELAAQDNVGRYRTIVLHLERAGHAPIPIPLAEDTLPPNLLVSLRGEGPYSLFTAHYDKSRETAGYEGASDNAAAVCALMAALDELASARPTRSVAVLFTSAEERGALGAKAFLAWRQREGMDIGEVIVLDMIGRDLLAVRPAADPGFRFWLPLLGPMTYDGRRLHPSDRYNPVDPELRRRLRAGDDHAIVRHAGALVHASTQD